MKRIGFMTMTLLFLGLSGMGFAQTAAQYINAGNQSYGAKDFAKAVQYYQAAVQADPNSAAAYQGLGNSYYQQGQNSEALGAYEKALNLNPNNAQLSTFVQSLRAKVGTAAPAAQPAAAAPASSGKTKTIELNLKLGVGLASNVGMSYSGASTSLSDGMGFGGGAEGYYLLPDGHLGLGLIINYYTGYGQPAQSTTIPYFNQSFQPGTATVKVSYNDSVIEVMPGVKYMFDGNGLRPYVLGSVGFASLSSSGSVDISYSNGPPPIAIPTSSYGGSGQSSSGLMAQAGAGAEFSMGPDMGLFLQAKYSMVFLSQSIGGVSVSETFSDIPVEAGVNFGF